MLLMGTGGFIGSHLAEELVTCSASERGFLRYNSRGEEINFGYSASKIRREAEMVYGALTHPREQPPTKISQTGYQFY
jgi:dTDP-glucose 4,6-dehydratase